MGGFGVMTVAAAVSGLLGLLAWAARRGTPKSDPATGTLLFRHSPLFRGFALFSAFGVPLGITVLVIFNPPKKDGDTVAILGLYLLFGVLSAPLLWGSMRFALTVSPDGLDFRSPWRGRRFVSWNEVEEVTYRDTHSWFVVRTTDGWTFRVSVLIPGLSEFLAACERHLPPADLAGAWAGYARLGRPFPGLLDTSDFHTKWDDHR
jgi:hypothetical protein